MTMLAEAVDAIVGSGTYRDSHEVEIADLTGKPIAMMRIGNDSGRFTQLLAAIAELAPGPRVAVLAEGSRSYGIGLARTLTAAGLLVIECGQLPAMIGAACATPAMSYLLLGDGPT